jgi:serine/threonine protein phosphatase PrpC
MHFSAHGATSAGRRSTNEDALFVDPALGLFIVADGMGGHNAGEVAARLAIDAISDFVVQSRRATDLTWPYGLDPALSVEANRLRNAVRLANNRVLEAASSRPEYAGMGTTVVAALVDENRVIFVGVGDSRVYLCQRAGVEQLTRDDSWIATVLARDPGLTETTLAQHPMRHVLTSVVGARADTEPRVSERDLAVGDVLLLCTDGLHGALSTAEIGSVLDSDQNVDEMTGTLIDQALANGATDNVTVIVVRCEK